MIDQRAPDKRSQAITSGTTNHGFPMTALKTDFLREISERGFVHQCTDLDGLDALMSRAPVTAYIGFDCTADSLHVGSLLPIMLLHWLQRCGHKPIVLMGGGTTKVGDPSGKDDSRQLLSETQIEANMAAQLAHVREMERNGELEPIPELAEE